MEDSKEHSEETTSRFEAMIGRIFIRIALIVLPILLVDYVSPLFLSHRRSKIEKKFGVQTIRQPKPYIMFGGVENGRLDTNDTLNNLGYRGKAPSDTKAVGDYRVFMLGGSTVFNGEPPISVLLEEKFRREGKDNVEVYNFGVVSSTSGMELARILFEISDLQPDLIIMYNGGNDMLSPRSYDPRPGYPYNFIVYENNPLLENDVRSYPSFSLLLYGSNLARYFLPKYFMKKFVPLVREREKVDYGSDQWKDEIAETYVANMVKADKISATFGAEFLAFFQPMVYYKDQLSEREKLLVKEEDKDYYIDMRKRIMARIESLTEDPTPVIIGLSDIYDEIEEVVFLVDCIHTKQESKIVAAEAIYTHIVNNFTVE